MYWRQWRHLVVGRERLETGEQLLKALRIPFTIQEKDSTCCGWYDRDCTQHPLRQLIFQDPESGQELVIEEYIKLDGRKGDGMVLIDTAVHPLAESGESSSMTTDIWLPPDDPVP